MLEPGLPENEADRLHTLRRLHILDTPPEDRFDRYTRISARIFDMPISLISLVDRYRQWFKSTEGFDGKETPRNISFCGHAILGDDVFEIQNTRRDPRFRDNPLVIDRPNIRFYAGAPLKVPNGHKLGTLCIIDRVPRRLSDDEKTMLGNLADMVVGEMVNYVDTETGLANRNALMSAGARCFDVPAAERNLSLLLFDINDAVASHNDLSSETSPAERFSKLLNRHFPAARSIAHTGGNAFCVLLAQDRTFDETMALSRLCAATNQTLCPEGKDHSLSILVGRVPYDSRKHASFDDMIHEADGMFYRREKQPLPESSAKNRLIQALIEWRQTST